MSAYDTFKVPSKSITVKQEIKGSKFITNVGRVGDKQKAKEFIEYIRRQYNNATHNCYAFVAGNPYSTTDIGFGDDGEVPGTAGKPMLSVLQHKKIGEIAVVVTRYFGGTKLGTGGLVRAYTSSVQMALDKLPLEKYQLLKTVTISFDYQYENSIRNVISTMNLSTSDEQYEQRVKVKIPEDLYTDFINQVQNISRGQIKITNN
jgi:uncharacterized YigZ family protein